MGKYENVLLLAERNSCEVKEKDLRYYDGLAYGNRIAIRRSLKTSSEKACVLAEELGHCLTTVGDITDYENADNWKQEVRARTVGYHIMIHPEDLISAYNAGCANRYEIAEHIGVTEEFLEDAIERFRQIYGAYFQYGRYIIVFEPSFGVVKL